MARRTTISSGPRRRSTPMASATSGSRRWRAWCAPAWGRSNRPRLARVHFVRAGVHLEGRCLVAELQQLRQVDGEERTNAAARLVLRHMAELVAQQAQI